MLNPRTPVLIVDDYQAMRGVLRSMLQYLGLNNISEDDGNTAMDLLRQRDFGLVISNLVMAPISGIELLRRVRGDQRLAGLPFVLATSMPQEALVLAAKELAVDGFLVKPFNVETLRRVLSAAIDGKAARAAGAAVPMIDHEAERGRLRRDIAALADQLERRRAMGTTLLVADAAGLVKSYMERAIKLGMERHCLDQLTALSALLSEEAGGKPADLIPSATARADRRSSARRLMERTEPNRRQTEAEMRRRHLRFVAPILHVRLGGRTYRTLDWSLGGLSLTGWSGSLSAGKLLKVDILIAGSDDPAAVFSDRVAVVRGDNESGRLALRFLTHSSATLRILEYLTRRGEQARVAAPESEAVEADAV